MIMNLKKIKMYKRVYSIIIVLILNLTFITVYSQNTQPTPYQKKQLELSKKWYQILAGYQMSMTDEAFYEQMTAGKEANDFVLGLAIFNYAATHSKTQCEKVFTQMGNEFKQAEKLKNATDFKLEQEAKAHKLKMEKEKILLAEQEAYQKTDVGNIRRNVQSAFEKWNQKGEFEKEIDYAERLKTQSQKAFEEICIKQIKDKIKNYNNEYNFKKELSTYDSENEFFTVSFKINGVEWQNKINIPISQAQNFKTEWSDLDSEINDYDWCFVENSLCPTVITLRNQDNTSKYKFPLSLNNQLDISYSFDNLGIDNPYLSGYIFKYSNAKAIAEQVEKEKQRLDSLELATYNQKLDIIFQNYNQQLLQNPYNTAKRVLTTFDKIGTNLKVSYYESLTDIRQTKFDEYKDEIEREFKSLNNSFEKELKSSNPTEYSKIYFSQNPEKKTEADKKYLECKCNYPSREDYDFKFITENLYNCNCRATEFGKNGKLFASKEEFNSFYEKGEEVYLLESERRATLNYLSVNSILLQSMNFQEDKNEILTIISESQNKPYYLQVLDFAIETNNGLNKEWTKNGQFFESKTQFYNAYISEDYKNILKYNKKNN